MADEGLVGFSEQDSQRISDVVEFVEGMERVQPDFTEPEREVGDVDTFVIASDPSEYSEQVGLLPLGYRGHVIAYRIDDEFDLRKLPAVPSLDDLLKKAASKTGAKNVADWAEHDWVDQYADKDLGSPILLNVCRFGRGAYFRGQVVTARISAGFRCSDAWRGTHFAYAAPTWGEWPEKSKAADPKFFAQPGWCVIDPGYLSLVVTLRGELDPLADPEYATADVSHLDVQGKTLEMVDPSDEESEPTIYVYSYLSLDDPIPEDSEAVIDWQHLFFRWNLTSARCP